MNPDAPGSSPLALRQAVGWVLLAGVIAYLASGLVAVIVSAALAGAGMTPSPAAPPAAVYLPAVAASMLVLGAVAVAAPLVLGAEPRTALGLRRAPALSYPVAALGVIALAPLSDLFVSTIARWAPDIGGANLETIEHMVSNTSPLLIWPFLALLPGISEELLFRGLLQNAAGRGLRAIMISALGFALFHLDPHHVVGVLPQGFFLAWVGSRAGTWVTIFAHVVHNTFAIASMHVEVLHVGHGSEVPMPGSWLPLGMLLCGLCALSIVRMTRA
ncbi:MAG: CPBP family intramembrane metalloprotease [Myxococcales bacterium]|nr:CPBP family intramembrane metalloprotease [Myxococcales bacterium]